MSKIVKYQKLVNVKNYFVIYLPKNENGKHQKLVNVKNGKRQKLVNVKNGKHQKW